MKNIRKLFIAFFFSSFLFAQNQNLKTSKIKVDGVSAVIGDYVILESDIDKTLVEMKSQGIPTKGISRCQLLGKLMEDKLYAHHAIQDSLEFSIEEIYSTVDQIIDNFTQQLGSIEKVLDFYNKDDESTFRQEIFEINKTQKLSSLMQAKIVENIEVTPEEVRIFFESIPTIDLPVFGTELEISQIVIEPDVSVITNINYAHLKNFKNIKQIALAKAEIIKNTRTNGFIVLNADDNFFKLHQRIAFRNNIQVISFGIKSQKSNIKFISIKKDGNNYKIYIKVNRLKKYFLISNNFQNNIYNILAALAIMSIYINIFQLNKNIFLNFETPQGRGDFSRIKINNKNINLIDESYNSNPLSLKSALSNYDKFDTKKTKKYVLLGDMLELGNNSKKLHQSIAPVINRTGIEKVFVKGRNVISLFNKLTKYKKGRILNTKNQIIELIRDELNNNDYLMVKASNATGLNKIVKNLKGLS